MKKVLLAAIAIFAMQAAVAHAAIDLSRHDMGAMGGAYAVLAGSYGDCSACHVPHKAQGAKLWAKPITAYDISFAVTGPLCARCHDGLVVGGNNSANLNYGPYNSAASLGGHRLLVANTPTQPDGSGGAADVRASTNPHTAGTGAYMECTSCHDVHAPGNRPFIGNGFNINNICTSCHLGRVNAAYGTSNPGLHPVTVAGDILIQDGTQGGANPITNAMVAKSAGTGVAADPAAWNSGPHAGAANGMYCTSCHVVHGDEPTAADGTIYNGVYDASLLLAPQNGTADGTTGGSGAPLRNSFCEYCHTGGNPAAAETAGTRPNPGGTDGTAANMARSYHPADSGLNNGAGRLVAITEPLSFPFLTAAPNLLGCNSCHAAHGSNAAQTDLKPNTPLLRATLANPTASFCMYCHDAANDNFDCFHAGHFQTADGSGGTLAAMGPTGMGTSWGTGTASGFDCNICHRAHNAPYQPILRFQFGAGATRPDELCTNCHSVNPSIYTVATPMGAAPESLATHFVGNPAGATAALWTTGSVPPPSGLLATNGYAITAAVPANLPERTAAWRTSIASIYGPNNAVTCLSCHSMRYCGDAASVIDKTGDAAGTYMMITSSGNGVTVPAGDIQSGALQTRANATTGNYLCSGCHSADPISVITGSETGFTHPLAAAASGSEMPKANTTMTKATDGSVNCESCHRAHDADSNSGTYILESNNTGALVTGAGTGTSLAPVHVHDTFCNGCHSK
jgi:predicted CXXCH cytochrome family protein